MQVNMEIWWENLKWRSSTFVFCLMREQPALTSSWRKSRYADQGKEVLFLRNDLTLVLSTLMFITLSGVCNVSDK